MRRDSAENLIPLDLEIERTLKRILRDKRKATRMEQLPMGPMEENREEDVGSIRRGSIHLDATNMDTMLPPIRDYGCPSVVTPLVIRRSTIQAKISSSSPSLSSYCKEFNSTDSHMRTRMLISLIFWRCVT